MRTNHGTAITCHRVCSRVIVKLVIIIIKNNTPNLRSYLPCLNPEGGQGVRTPTPEKSQKIVYFSDTGSDPQKINKATKPEFNFGPLLARR